MVVEAFIINLRLSKYFVGLRLKKGPLIAGFEP